MSGSSLPSGWVLTTIGDVAIVNPPGSTVSAPDEQPVTFLPMAAVEELTGRIDTSDVRSFGAVKKGFTRFRDGDVLVAKITPSMENGKVAVAKDLTNGKGCGSTEFHVIRPCEGVAADYLRYFLVRSAFRQEARRNMQGAVGQQRVPANFLRDAPLPMAPGKQQTRIVSKIDELFSRIEEGERALERVQKLVERYRQSVLKAAVTGELTRAWREQRKGQLESGEALLERILKARREAWEQSELDKMKAKGIRPANDKWKQKYQEPLGPDAADLPELPNGWVWVRAEQVCDFITKGTTPVAGDMTPDEGDVPYIKVYNLTFDGSLNFGKDPTFVKADTHRSALARSRLLPGDVVMNIVGPPLGKVSVVPDTYPEWNMNQAVCVFRPLSGLDRQFLCNYLLSRAAQDFYVSKSKATVGQLNLTLEICRDTPIPLPSLDEQLHIAELASLEQSRFSNLIASLERDTQLASGLRQSVLKAAFSGELLRQDSKDEPASVLLQRIEADCGSSARVAVSR